MEQTATNEVSIYNRAVETFIGGGQILAQNQLIASKAVAAGHGILQRIEANGGKLDATLDTLANDYLVKVAQRSKELNEARKPITQMMDEVKKMFTSVESGLDVKVSSTIPFKIQQFRNEYAKEEAERERRRAEEAERRAAKERERVQITAVIEGQLYDYFNGFLLHYKQQMQAGFNGITLENFQEKERKLNVLPTVYSHDHFTGFQALVNGRLHSTEEISAIACEVTEMRLSYEHFAPRFTSEIEELKRSLLDRLPSKKAELESHAAAEKARLEEERRAEEERRVRQLEIEKADGERKRQLEEQARIKAEEDRKRQEELKLQQQRLEADRRNREQEEQDRIAREAEEARKRAEQEIEMNKAAAETLVLFDKEAELSAGTPAPETRQGFEITVHHPAGYVQVFQFWFENEGKNLGIDKIAGTKLEQMKAWCEKHAHKTGEVIDSKFLQYSPTYKAVNRKQK